MSNMVFNQFYQRFGVRSISTLSNPRVYNIDNFVLPKNSIVHYLPENALDLGPSQDYFVFRNERVRPYADNITEQKGTHGNPRKKGAINFNSLTLKWLQTHRNFRRTPDILRALDDKSIAIMANYSFVHLQWRYQPLPLTRYYRFQNLMETVYDRAAFYAANSNRQQFFFVRLPDVLPTRQHFNISVEAAEDPAMIEAFKSRDGLTGKTFEEALDFYYPGISKAWEGTVAGEAFDESSLGWGEPLQFDQGSVVSNEAMNRYRLGLFPNDAGLMLLDLWQWMTLNRRVSLLSKIPDTSMDKINFVFMRNGKFTVLNMSYMLKWVKDETSGKGESYKSISAKMVQHIESLHSMSSVMDKTLLEEALPDENGEGGLVGVNQPEPQEGDTEIIASENPDGGTPVTYQRRVEEEPQEDDDIPPEELFDETPAEPLSDTPAPTPTEEPVRKGIRTLLLDVAQKKKDEPTSQRLGFLNKEPLMPVEPPVDEPEVDPLVNGVEKHAGRLLNKGLISRAEYARHVRLANRFREIPAPFDNAGTLAEYKVIPPEVVWDFKPKQIPDIEHVKDKSMLKSTLINFDQTYVTEVMQKDVLNMVLNLQKDGFAITDYKVERRTDALNDLYEYTVKISPVHGSPSTIRFQLPAIDSNNKYTVGGVKYYMRKLRFDKPIRKISDETVALSTYYGKLFVERSTKRSDDYATWLNEGISANTMIVPPIVLDAQYGSTFGDGQPVPQTYSTVAKEFASFTVRDIHFVFDYPNIAKNFPEWNGKGYVPVARFGNEMITMDFEGRLWQGATSLGPFEKLMGLDPEQIPIQSVNIGILGQSFPLAIVLFYLQGLNNFIEEAEIKPQRRMKGSRVEADPNSFEIVFADEIWRLPRIRHKDVLIYASLLQWKKSLRNFSVAELDDRDTYGTLLSQQQLSGRYLYEFTTLESLFIDPVAEDNLKMMEEPTEFIPLLKKASFYLVTDEYPSDLSAEWALFKGYERMTGAVYRGIIDGVRRFNNQPMGSKSVVDIPPYQILSDIQKDPSVSLVEDSNPIHNLKEKENVTYSGTGGRSKRSMVRRTRAFHSTDLGIRAEAGVDNGDVGINCFLTANPNLTSLRGTARPEVDPNPKVTGIGNLLSTSALISPFATYDDPKRVNFINIQQSHVIQSKGATPLPIRTGYEQIMAHRVDDLFAYASKGAGVVAEKGKTYVVFKYDDPALGEKRIELGRRFGTVTGHTVPHATVCDLEVGQKFVEGQVLTFHPGFFARDWRNPQQVLAMTGPLSNIVLMENNSTFEDASLISRRLSKQLETTVTHTRTVVVNFTQGIRNLVEIGQHLDTDDNLAFIEDEVSALSGNFDEASMDVLRRKGNPAARSKFVGTVEKIDVHYFGDKEDMTASVRAVADKYDNLRAKRVKQLNSNQALTGQIMVPTTIDGISVELDMIAITIYITHTRGMGDGDKIVVGNQKKSVVSGVFDGVCRTNKEVIPGKGKMDIDIQFSYRAVNARIVPSALLFGMSSILLDALQQRMLEAFDKAE